MPQHLISTANAMTLLKEPHPMKPNLSTMLGLRYPVLVAPMFLVSNASMVIEALNSGGTAAIPALNYRTESAMREAVAQIRSAANGPFGFNLIVNKSNPKWKQQLSVLADLKVDFIITSLGSPEEVIKKCKPLSIKVFCDVVNLAYAKKVEAMGADALIAVGSEAGGHCGPVSNRILIPELVEHCRIPVIAAGGISRPEHVREMFDLGAAGVSVGTIFIASVESPVSDDYKQALIKYKSKDIVLSTRLSGSHLTVINTPYVQQIGTKGSFLEHWMKRHKRFRNFLRMIIFARGMKKMEKAAFKATYQTVWVAGPAIDDIHSVRPLRAIMQELTAGF